jgi:hypothetical protein
MEIGLNSCDGRLIINGVNREIKNMVLTTYEIKDNISLNSSIK